MSTINSTKLGSLSIDADISLPNDITNYVSAEISSKADNSSLAYGYRVLSSEIVDIGGIGHVRVSAENGAVNIISNLVTDAQMSVFVNVPAAGKITEFVLRLSTDNVENPSYMIELAGNPIKHNYSDGDVLEKNSEYLNLITIMPAAGNGGRSVNSYDIMSSLKRIERD